MNSECKSPVAVTCLVLSSNSKKARVAETEWVGKEDYRGNVNRRKSRSHTVFQLQDLGFYSE